MIRPLVALDIGSTKVACAIGLPHEDTPGFDLLGSSVIPYPSLSNAWLSDPLLVGRTIEQALESTAITGDFHRALVTISHPALVSEQVQTSIDLADEPIVVRTQDLDRLKARALDHVLGVDREPLFVERLGCSGNGFQYVREPVGLSATRLTGTFHIVTMPLAARRALVQAVESAGLEVGRLMFSLQVVAATAAKEEAHRRHALLMDIGGLNTDVGLLVEGRLQNTQTIPWGGLTLARDLATSSKLTFEQAITLSLEGLASRKPEVRQFLEHALRDLRQVIERLLEDEPLPEIALVTGRGALIDGIVEWLEETTKIKASVVRSPRTQIVGDLSRQIALSTVLSLLELETGSPARKPLLSTSHLLDRVISRTKTVLTEYF